MSHLLRYTVRALWQTPGFTTVAVTALALGIGANTAVFSVVNGVLLRPLPYPDPDRLVQLRERTTEFNSMSVAYPNFLDWSERCRSFTAMAAYRWENYDLTGRGEAEHLSGKNVSAAFFRILGATPLLGRDFDPAEDRLGTAPVVMLSGGLWKRRFGSNPSILGKQLTLNGREYTVAGVVPADFLFEGKADVYTLLGQWDNIVTRDREMHPGISVVAALKPGVTLAAARAEAEAVAAHLAETYPNSNKGHGINVEPLAQVIVGDVRPTLLVLLGAVTFVLLIACANVANLLLARSAARRREIAIRSAMGAGRARVIRLVLTESLVLALAGGVAGLAIAKWGALALVAAVPGGLPRMESIAVDWRVLAFTLVVSVFTGIAFGLAPVFQAPLRDLNEILKEGGRGSTAGPHRLRSALVVAEVAAAVVLLIGAGLMLRTMMRLNGVNPGFETRNLLTFSGGRAPANSTSSERIFQSLDDAAQRTRAVPGVKSASYTALLPLSGNDNEIPFYVTGRARPTSQGEMLWALLYCTGPGYLDAMNIPLLRGRYFTPADDAHAARVVIIDEVMARSVFANEDPLGKSINVADLSGSLGPEFARPMQIVGIAGHVYHWSLDGDPGARIRSQIYLPFRQIPDAFVSDTASSAIFVAHTARDPLSSAADVRRAVQAGSPDQPVYGIRSMQQIIDGSVAGRRFSMLLLGVFACVAILLAAVGIYAVIAYTVAQRTHEIGIRMALGARPRDVLAVVLRQAMLPVAAGVSLGLAAALGLTRLMSAMLYGVGATDPATFLAVIAGLAAVALLAGSIPAMRAAHVDPTLALRHE